VSSPENEKKRPRYDIRDALKASRRPDEYAYAAVCLIASALLEVAESRPLMSQRNDYEVKPLPRRSTGPECVRMAHLLSAALDFWAEERQS